MNRDEYIQIIRRLFSADSRETLDANRYLYHSVVLQESAKIADREYEADLALAEAINSRDDLEGRDS